MKGKHGNVFSSMSLAKSLRHRADLLSAFFHCFAFFFCRACKTKTDACSLPFVLLFYFSTLLSRSFLMPFDATHAGPCVGRGGGGADPPVHSPHDWLGSWRFPLGQQAVQVQSLVTWPVAEIEFLKRLRSPGLHLTRLPFSHGLPGPAGSGHHHQLGLNGFHLANSTHAAEIYARQVRELIHFVLLRILHI